MDITIKKLELSLLEDFLYFFDNVAFTDNPEWSACYCQFYHFKGKRDEWVKRTGKENREAAKKLITLGDMNGFLAYQNGNPIGWCNANLKHIYPVLTQDKDINYSYEGKIASVVCFIIAPEYRKQGVARKLLQFAIDYYKSNKFDFLEAYPRKNVQSDAHNYKGPLSMYKSEGFSVFKEFKGFYIVRKSLK
ncbi:MAG: GNAT family N-acetyltransferase [Candidatus Hodarchaeota archaeon]